MTAQPNHDIVLSTIRAILTEDHNAAVKDESEKLSPEKATESFSNQRLQMVREVDPNTFKKWFDRAIDRITKSPSTAS